MSKTVIQMAKEAGFPFNKFGLLQSDDNCEIDADQMLERLVELARADERAKLAEQSAQPAQQPWAWLFQHEETGLTQCVDTQQVEWGFEKNNPRWQKIAPLYTTPQAQPAREWVGMTDEEISAIWSWSMTAEAERTANTQQHAFARAIEAKLKG